MQIVIDVPNWLYNAIMECKEPHYSKSLGEAVRDGTPLEQEPKWIPCGEKLPEKGKSHLVTEQAFGGHTFLDVIGFARDLSLVSDYEFKDKKRPGWFDYDSEYGYYERTDVVAWMSLPEPYKKGE